MRGDDAILVFGDADMSFSYDLCRYYSTCTSPPGPPRVTVTAYDPKATGVSKYATLATHVQKILDLRVLSKKQSKKRKRGDKDLPLRLPVDVQIYHGVDCLDPPSTITAARHPHPRQYSQVIFNHPHLGVESAASHTRFLHHFFNTIKTLSLLHPQGALLTTFAGSSQSDRWNVVPVAQAHGFHLNSARDFTPPHIDPQTFKTEKTNAYSTFRRCHSGKSFNTNAPSVTFVFTLEPLPVVDVPWMVERDAANDSVYECLECNKKFTEKRSLVNHLKDSIKCSSEKKKETTAVITCDVCGDGRTFVDLESLNKHILQKHTGVVIPKSSGPSTSSEAEPNSDDTEEGKDSCRICGVRYTDKFTEEDHSKEFAIDKDEEIYQCEKCGKTFREIRSLTQHKNLNTCITI